jgi:ankyrin repeat protein
VQLYIEKGADTNLTSKDGQTALVVAVGRNDADVARLLVAGGADPDLADKLGLSARKYAALFKNPAILSLFEPNGQA